MADALRVIKGRFRGSLARIVLALRRVLIASYLRVVQASRVLLWPVNSLLGIEISGHGLTRDRARRTRPWLRRLGSDGHRGPVRVLLVGKFRYGLFASQATLDFLRAEGIEVAREGPADVHLVERLPGPAGLARLRLRTLRPTPIVLWTAEPRWDTHVHGFYPGRGLRPDIHIMNCYTGDVWVAPATFNFPWQGEPLEPLQEVSLPAPSDRRVIALMTYRPDRRQWSLVRDGRELDLTWSRQQIALRGHELGMMDICGAGWPDGIAHEVSREPPWQKRKIELLKSYHFNLAFENTIVPNYITEKIWDSIRGGCLPIYYGCGNNVYDLFPRKSFLDYADFGDPDALFQYIRAMSVEEYRERMNLCIEAHNRAFESYDLERVRARTMMRFVEKVREVVPTESRAGASV